MDSNQYYKDKERLKREATKLCNDLIVSFGLERLRRLSGAMTWCEISENRELSFEVQVFRVDDEKGKYRLSVGVILTAKGTNLFGANGPSETACAFFC